MTGREKPAETSWLVPEEIRAAAARRVRVAFGLAGFTVAVASACALLVALAGGGR